MKGLFFGVLLVTVIQAAFGQVPQIDKVEKITDYPFATVQITGSGFSATTAQLQVWFGNVKGNIVSSSETFINVQVPAQASLNNVEVINLASKRAGKSKNKFVPNFSGVQPLGNFTVQSFASPANDIFDLCTCDFDLNGKTDIVGSKFRDGSSNLMLMTNTSTVLANNTTMNFSVSSIPLSVPTFSVACGDLNGDGKPELVATRGGNTTGNIIYIFPNTSSVGSISFGTPVALNIAIGDFAKEIAIRDLNKDGRAEIVVTNGQTNVIYIFENKLTSGTIVDTEFTRVDKTVAGNTAPDGTAAGTLSLVVQDFNGDGWPEILVTPNKSYANQKIFILTNPANGTVNFLTITNFQLNGSANINDVSTADFNNDGRMDLVFADRANDKAFVLTNLGSMAFSSVNGTTGFVSSEAWGTDVADMNGDGFVDFVVGCRDFAVPQVNVFISNGAATPSFTKTTLASSKGNWFVKAGDYDGDSKPDIAVTSTNNSNSFSIDIWKNKTCHQPVILNDNPLVICNGQTITLKAVPIQGVSFSWSKGTNTGATSNITFSDTGTITLTATGEGGACTPTATITVNSGAGSAPATPTITQPAGVCAGSSLTLQTNSVAGATYLWTGPNNYSASTATPSSVVIASATASQKGDYFLQVKVGDCTSTRSAAKFVDVIAPASFTITGSSSVCTGQPLALSVNSSTEYNFQWKLNGSNILSETDPAFPKTPRNAVAADEGNYTVFVSHKTIACTSETSPFALNVFTAPSASFTKSPAQVCVGTAVTFDASGSSVDNTASFNYAWTFGDGGTSPNETTATTTHTYNVAQTSLVATLVLSYTGVTGCSSSFNAPAFDINSATQPTIVTDPLLTVLEICSDGSETVQLTVQEIFDSYVWSTSQNGQTISVNEPGIYSVETTNDGCVGNAQIELTAKPGCDGGEIDIQIQKTFTPNNDNINDAWKIVGIESMNAACEINLFDGRGKRVITLKQPDIAAGWKGTSSPSGGSPLPAGTYYYVFGCPNSKPVTGSVLIVR